MWPDSSVFVMKPDFFPLYVKKISLLCINLHLLGFAACNIQFLVPLFYNLSWPFTSLKGSILQLAFLTISHVPFLELAVLLQSTYLRIFPISFHQTIFTSLLDAAKLLRSSSLSLLSLAPMSCFPNLGFQCTSHGPCSDIQPYS